VLVTLGGDFLVAVRARPRVDGQPLAGRQAVSASICLAWTGARWQSRIDLNEEQFRAPERDPTAWCSSNVTDAGGRVLPGAAVHDCDRN
jgi:hypothetical protein